MMRTKEHDVLIPAMDVLIGEPEILSPTKQKRKKVKVLAIPEDFIYYSAQIRSEISNRGDACTEILKSFSRILSHIHQDGCYICENGMEIEFIHDYNEESRHTKSSKKSVLLAAKKYREKYPDKTLAILTGDDAMASMAYNAKIDVAHVNPEIYTGRCKVVMPLEYYSNWNNSGIMTADQFYDYYPKAAPLIPNKFIEFESEPDVPFDNNCQSQYIGRVQFSRNGELVIRKLRYLDNLPHWLHPQTAGQAMFLEAVFAPHWDIPIVICDGIYGTGKTFLAVSGAYHQTATAKEYDRIFVVPSEGSIGKDLGALPGEKEEKILPHAAPVIDNLYNMVRLMRNRKRGQKADEILKPSVIKRQVEDDFNTYFELEAMSYVGGRTISDAVIIYDEFQALERYQAKQLLTRVGDCSKLICIGDRHQVYNPHMNAYSNGLAYASSKLKGSSRAAVITFNDDEVVRSDAAREIAMLMG